ncbi:MAG TPA: PIG-L family deacetylase [Bacteroidetes bacterium]|nr:PIG-L family deacetylase [Bacteroidota bacterium]
MKYLKSLLVLLLMSVMVTSLVAQPEIPLEQWTGKKILLVGAHPDDDAGRHGTLSMLQENGNEVYILLLTAGNVGTRDRTMTRQRLEKIRRHEQQNAMTAIGIPTENYINLGYTDGMIEFANYEDVIRRIVWWYRKIQPDVLVAFEPGYRYTRWHKTDHRMAATAAVDAARAAEWHLVFPDQVIQEGLEPISINEYLFWGSEGDNVTVDIAKYVPRKVQSRMSYLSQFSQTGTNNYPGDSDEYFMTLDDLPAEERAAYIKRFTDSTGPTETFRYYRGAPDGVGNGPALGGQ